jgi:aspartate oxidase
MWRDAGLVRDAAGLERVRSVSHPLARLVADGALVRAESRGGHFRIDHPSEHPDYLAHVVHRPGTGATLEVWS